MTNSNDMDDGFFKIDPECHLIGDMELINHFPGVQMWWRAIDNVMRPLMQGTPAKYYEILEPWEMQKSADPENIIRAMDKYGVDIACLLPESMMDTTGYSSRFCTNGETWKVAETHPDRFIIEPNLSPIKHRGVANAIWEMEFWVERGTKIFKYYPPEDTQINDPDLWPFYRRAEELGIVLDIHTGFSWVPPGKSKNCLPIQLDDVARDFPNLKLVAFHMGYPYCDDLNMVAMGHPNVYLCLSLLVPWAISAPYKFAKILGEAMRFAGPDRIIWGTDCAGFAAQIGTAVMGLRNFQIPDELQWQYGYLPLTDDDKRKMFGGNLAELLGIDPSVRRIAKSEAVKEAEDVTALESIETTKEDSKMETTKEDSKMETTKEDSKIDTTYEVIVSSPLGELPGKAVVDLDGKKFSGMLHLLKHDNPFTGTLDGEKLAFSGSLKTPIGSMAYTVTGTLKAGKIEGMAKTKIGDLKIRSK